MAGRAKKFAIVQCCFAANSIRYPVVILRAFRDFNPAGLTASIRGLECGKLDFGWKFGSHAAASISFRI